MRNHILSSEPWPTIKGQAQIDGKIYHFTYHTRTGIVTDIKTRASDKTTIQDTATAEAIETLCHEHFFIM